MKTRILFCLTAAVVIAASCEKTGVASSSDEMVALTVNVSGLPAETKVTNVSEADEKALTGVQLFVFDASGAREIYKSGTGSVITASCKPGTKTIYAVVNAPVLDGIATVTALEQTASLLADNARNKFVMVGALKSEPVSVNDDSKTIDVTRIVSKVVLKKIQRKFTDATLAAKTMTIKSVYLTDVVANACLDSAPSQYQWLNKLQYVPTDDNRLLYDSVNRTVAQNGVYSTEHVFYAYPNATDNKPKGAEAGTWSPRNTMLVIEADIDGRVCYYPVYLPALESNKTYIITDFTLTKIGSDHPWEIVESSDISFEIHVVDWQDGAEITETI